MSLLKKLAGETALYGLSSMLRPGTEHAAARTPAHAHAARSTDDFGAVVDLYATSAFLMVISPDRMESAFFRFGTPKEDRSRAFSTGMLRLWAAQRYNSVTADFCGSVADFLQNH
jgi:hypothetical protein